MVAPFAGAWIEIKEEQRQNTHELVAPFAGAWIEIDIFQFLSKKVVVAPFAGAWIEIESILNLQNNSAKSHPSRVRGLKYNDIIV